MKKRLKNGYSSSLAAEYVDPSGEFLTLCTELEVKYVFAEKTYTEEIDHYKAWFIQEGSDPFMVKFSEEITLPDFLKPVTIDNLQACEYNRTVYFKADGVKEVK